MNAYKKQRMQNKLWSWSLRKIFALFLFLCQLRTVRISFQSPLMQVIAWGQLLRVLKYFLRFTITYRTIRGLFVGYPSNSFFVGLLKWQKLIYLVVNCYLMPPKTVNTSVRKTMCNYLNFTQWNHKFSKKFCSFGLLTELLSFFVFVTLSHS